jgi:hypothetical protein
MRDPTTFPVTVDGVGSFVCRRRTMRTAIAITAEYSRLTEGMEQVPVAFAGICNFIAYLKVMVLTGPSDWDPYLTDPDSQTDMDRMGEVYAAVKDAEGRFRAGAGKDPQGTSPGTVGVD